MDRDEILKESMKVINNERNADYGDARENFENTSKLWSAYTGYEIGHIDVAVMMVLLKISRIRVSPDKADHWVDICGYSALAGEIGSDGR